MNDAADLVDRPDRWRLLDERDFLRRSLDDAEREHAAGDLADADYALLRRRDEARLAQVESALTASEPPPGEPEGGTGGDPGAEPLDGSPPRRRRRTLAAREGVSEAKRGTAARPRRRRWLAVGGVAVLLAGALVLVLNLASPRLPGEAPTGSISLSQAQQEARQLQRAQSLVDGGHPARALQVYSQVLSEDPKSAVALAEWGWLEWQAASSDKQHNVAADAQAAVAKAAKLQPSLYAAQYYLGTMLLDGGHAGQALSHFRAFLADHPPAKWLDDAAPTIRRAFTHAGQPVPDGVPAAPSAP